jgi:hypothetical protein
MVLEEALPSSEFLFGGLMAPQRVLEGDLSGMDGHDDLGLPAWVVVQPADRTDRGEVTASA